VDDELDGVLDWGRRIKETADGSCINAEPICIAERGDDMALWGETSAATGTYREDLGEGMPVDLGIALHQVGEQRPQLLRCALGVERKCRDQTRRR
jgi:hypothetical protein